MKKKVRELWELCFDDTKAFVDLYFDRRYSDDINMAVCENGQLVSALQMVPYTMTFQGERISVSYISGACTHPDYRSKGVMRKLLDQTHQRMYREGVMLSTLIPAQEWLFVYYEKRGYIPAFFYSVKHVDVGKLEINPSCQIEEYVKESLDAYPYFDRKMVERDGCVQHTEVDFHVILADLALSGGKLYIALELRQIVGMIFCIPHDGILYITELLADSGAIRESLLKSASMETAAMKIEYYTPSGKDGSPRGMIRIIRAEKFMQLYAEEYKSASLLIELSDDAIPGNNGRYLIENGMCRRVSFVKNMDVVPMNIEQLTRMCFENERLYMSLMLD